MTHRLARFCVRGIATAITLMAILVADAVAAAGPAYRVVDDPERAPHALAELVAVGDVVYFRASSAAHGVELWRSDGTADGTAMVVDLSMREASSYPNSLTAWGDRLAFLATDASEEEQLYVSDGTAAGTRRLAEIVPGHDWRHPFLLAAGGRYLYFAADAGVWRSDGTAADTIRYPLPIPAPGEFAVGLAGIFATPDLALLSIHRATECCESYDVARMGADPYQAIFFLDTPAGDPEAVLPTQFVDTDAGVFFVTRGFLHWTDGTTGRSFGFRGEVAAPTPFERGVAFGAAGDDGRDGLWYGTGGEDTTRLAEVDGAIQRMVALGDRLVFTSYDRHTDARALWRGSFAGAVLLRELAAGDLVAFDDVAVWFTADGDDATSLWATDGNPARTVRLQTLPHRVTHRLTRIGDQVFFGADDALWALRRDAISLPEPRPCAGDCDGDGSVIVSELVAGVDLALGRSPQATACVDAFCSATCGPGPGGQPQAISCLLRAVRHALDGCPFEPCAADGDCDDGNDCSVDRCTQSGCAHDCACV